MRALRRCRPQLIIFPIILACLSSFGTVAGADSSFVPAYHPELKISRAAGPIKIDGDVNDAGWSGAAKAANFAEHNPGNQTRPDVNTEVLITYDDDNLYVAWLCSDKPGEVRASFCERDRIFSDDNVILCLDTYGEATHAYEISANPYGVPGDLLFSSAYGEDGTYDMIFQSAGRITDSGWAAEMAIPFASLRFPDREEQVWRVDFWRNRPHGSLVTSTRGRLTTATRTAGPASGGRLPTFPASSRARALSCCRRLWRTRPVRSAKTACSPMAASRATSRWESLTTSALN